MPFEPRLPVAALLPAERAWFIVHPQGGLIAGEQDGRLVLPTDAQVKALGIEPSAAQHSLGVLAGKHAVAAGLPGDPDAVLGEGLSVRGLRALATLLDAETFAVAGRALHVIDWATTSRFCGRCGKGTEQVEPERCTRCPSCGLTQYPRIAPAIIVLVHKGEEALLARNARFPGAFFSTLAGFSEIGESLEETLVREVHEEVGIRVHNARYFGSQPWPFPHSLMIGFNADWLEGEIHVEPSEIAEAAWFRRESLPMIPPSLSIARKLINAWVAEKA